MSSSFHLAIPAGDLKKAEAFEPIKAKHESISFLFKVLIS